MIILPIYPQTAYEEKLLWTPINNTPLIVQQLDHLNSRELVIFTDQKKVHALAENLSIRTYLIHQENQPTSLFLPPGTIKSLNFLRKKKTVKPHKIMMVVNYRFFPLSTSLLHSLKNEFSTSNTKCLLGAVPIGKDHPCQLETFYTVSDISEILLIGHSSLDHILSHHNQNHLFFDSTGRLNIYHLSRSKLPFFDFSPHQNHPLNQAKHIEIQHGNNNIMYPFKTRKSSLANGVSRYKQTPLKGLTQKGKYAILHKNDKIHFFINNKDFQENSILRIWPIFKQEKRAMRSTQNNQKQWLNKKYTGPFFSCQKTSELETIIIATLNETDGKTAELSRFFQPPNPQWTYDYSKQILINTISSKKITGRQSFQEIFQPNAITIFKLKNADELPTLFANKKVKGHAFPPEQFIEIKEDFDILRASVLQNKRRTKDNPSDK